MSDKEILVYQTKQIVNPPPSDFMAIKKWSPSLHQPIPPGKPRKYILFYLFKILGVFKSSNYFYYFLSKSFNIASGFLVVPAYYRWPFMDRNSVQFTYVITKPEFRGQSLAWHGIFQASQELKRTGVTNFWYVTDDLNLASQKLAEKMGFRLHGKAKVVKHFFGLMKILEIKND